MGKREAIPEGRALRRSETVFSNYRMAERASHPDFGIRSQDTALPNPAPHRHEYLQIHVQLEGSTRHFLHGAEHPVGARWLAAGDAIRLRDRRPAGCATATEAAVRLNQLPRDGNLVSST